jgi:putative mRNA 3-end processing factor
MIRFTDKGLYCETGKFYIDPWRPVDKALITHAHSDHAYRGHGQYISTDASVPILKHRLGHDISCYGLKYGEHININGVRASFHPAGHVIGSAQIRLEHKGEIWVISGDYKTENDGICDPFEPMKCHHFVTETTFGLPSFRWKTQEEIFSQINEWWRHNATEGKVSILCAYSLGKAQRLVKHLDLSTGPLYTHIAIENMHSVFRESGIDLPKGLPFPVDFISKDLQKGIILCPPSALSHAGIQKIKNQEAAFVSGWMNIRGIRRRRNIEKGFVLSDHADWKGILDTVKFTQAENIYTTHGYKDIVARYLKEEKGLNAVAVYTEFNGEETDAE